MSSTVKPKVSKAPRVSKYKKPINQEADLSTHVVETAKHDPVAVNDVNDDDDWSRNKVTETVMEPVRMVVNDSQQIPSHEVLYETSSPVQEAQEQKVQEAQEAQEAQEEQKVQEREQIPRSNQNKTKTNKFVPKKEYARNDGFSRNSQPNQQKNESFDFDSEKYKQLDNEKYSTVTNNELLSILMARGLSTQNPILFADCKRLFMKLNNFSMEENRRSTHFERPHSERPHFDRPHFERSHFERSHFDRPHFDQSRNLSDSRSSKDSQNNDSPKPYFNKYERNQKIDRDNSNNTGNNTGPKKFLLNN